MDSAFKEFENKIASLNNNLGTVPQWDQLSDTEHQQMADTLKPAFAVDMETGKITFDQSALSACPKVLRAAAGAAKAMSIWQAIMPGWQRLIRWEILSRVICNLLPNDIPKQIAPLIT